MIENKSLEILLKTIEKFINKTQNHYIKTYKANRQCAEYYKGYLEGLKFTYNLIKIILGI